MRVSVSMVPVFMDAGKGKEPIAMSTPIAPIAPMAAGTRVPLKNPVAVPSIGLRR